MSEAETLDLIAEYASNAVAGIALYATITFAYLTVAYFVGAALSMFQTAAVSTLYVGFAIAAAASCVVSTQAWSALIASRPTILDSLPMYAGWYWDIFIALFFTAGIAVSIYFMYDVRKKGSGHAT